MEKLTTEEVLHVAKLARLKLTDEEIDKYSYQLKEILLEIEKINDIKVESDEIMISPFSDLCKLNDNDDTPLTTKEVLQNAPSTFDSYIEVGGAFDE